MWRADRVEILVLVENWIDMLLSDQGDGDDHCVTRAGLVHHFDPRETPVQAENGISLLVTAYRGAKPLRILFDVGLTGTVLAHNLGALRVDPAGIDHLVISHGHPDHYGGVFTFLDHLDRPLPLSTHPDAFLPRFAVMGDGRVARFYNAAFRPERLDAGPGRLVLSKDPVDLGAGVLTTGEIPRHVPFEGPVVTEDTRQPGLYQVDDAGRLRTDEVWDEQGLVVDLGQGGLVVLTGCAHAGVVNTIRRAQEITGNDRVRAVLGGFHLGFPTTPAANVEKTVTAMRELEVQHVVPMHCSGLPAHAAFSQSMHDRYVQPAVGSVFTFSA